MAKLGVFKLKGWLKPIPIASREPPAGTVQHSRPGSAISTGTCSTGADVGVGPPRGGLVTEPTRGNQYGNGQPQTVNVILFGEAGVGKSAVVNLIAQENVANVSADVRGCTMASTPYNITLDGTRFRIFDTVGLNQPDLVSNSHLEAIERAYNLILELKAAGGIHLLLFCMRRGKITMTTRNNYRLFVEFLCQKKVPVGVVVTNCEHQEPEMESWWTKNKTDIEDYGIRSNGHACITAVTDGSPGETRRYRESQVKICELLRTCPLENGAFMLDAIAWLAMLGKEIIKQGKTPKRRDMEKLLSRRLRLHPDNVKRIMDMMEKSDPSASCVKR